MRIELAAALLAGCASAPTSVLYLAHDCHGNEISVRYTEYVSVVPLIDCVRLVAECGAPPEQVLFLAAQLPVACAYRGPRCNVMVLPPIGTDLAREHEQAHMRGESHLPFLPFMEGCREPA
jgi:hypothetical protein